MDIVTAIAVKVAEPIVDYTVAPIAKQVGYLIFYKDNFNKLNDQVVDLKRVKDSIIHEVEAQRTNGRQIYGAVQKWLNRVDEIVAAAEKLGDDPRHRNAGCCKGTFPDLKSWHQLSRRAKKMAANVDQVMQEKDNISPLTFLPDLEAVDSTFATSSEKLESRKKMKEDIVLALRDSKLSRIGVYGLGGVGKTTLVKEISKQVKDDKLFDKVVMANISQNADLERIQGEIIDFLGLRFEEKTIVGRASRLNQWIKNEKKNILVILDDIWDILELDKLGIPMNDHKGCKLLLTSRNLDVLQKMETQKDFMIDVLNEKEAWSLFEDMVGGVVKDVRLRAVAIQVAQKCAGLIVLIVTVARALKNKDNIDSWKDALNQLESVDKEGMNKKIYSALEFSYHHLKGDDVKALFLLCGLLGPQIRVEYLLRCGMGLGIFKQIYTPKNARLKLYRLIGSLKASCLLLENNSNEIVEMHDIVHEVAVSIASRDQHACKIVRGDELCPSEEFLQRCTQIILGGFHIPKLPGRLECPNIKFFCLVNTNDSLSIPDSFFEGMKNLKVLFLIYMHLPSLPQSFHSLIDLQTLCLDFCVLGDMTNIGALTNLQILSLQGSSMMTLPRELGHLTHLRMLDLTESGIEIFPSNIISNLTKLEELYLGDTSINWNQEDSIEVNENASLSELRHLTNLTVLEIQIKGAWLLPSVHIMFDKLERYKIVIGDVWEWSDTYGVSKMLMLKLGSITHLGHGIKELIKGVVDLYLDEVHGISNVLYDLNGEGFPLLEHIHIKNNENIQHVINSTKRKLSHVFFPKLEILILQNLNKLEKICHGSFMNNSIKVECCDRLKYLFSPLMVKALSQLVEIEVSECSSMKKIVSIENSFPNSVIVDDNIEFCLLQSLTLRYLPTIEDFYSTLLTSSTTIKQTSSSYTNVPSSFFNSKVKFSSLETLKLSSIHLENIWQDNHLFVANSFHKLAILSVKECSNLKYLFPSSIVGAFPNLKELEISECEIMEEIIGTEGGNDTAIQEVRLPKLESVVISNMKRLKRVWHPQFEGLKTMDVNNCEKLENIFPSDHMPTAFARIETLKVSDCGSVREIFKLPANKIDTQLKTLHLLRLPKLKQIWSKDPQGNFQFHNLQDVHVEDCENLEYLFPFSIALDLHQLEKLKITFCEMNEIVAKKEGPIEEKVIFHFDRLYSLEIWSMYRLDRFYGGSHSLICPSLRMLGVYNCAKLKLLGRQNADDENPYQPLFMIEEVIPKLEEWTLNNKEAVMMLQDPQWKDHYLSKLKRLQLPKFDDKAAATFLDSIVQMAPNLKSLVVQQSSCKEIFRDKRIAYKEGKKKMNAQLQNLILFNTQLQHICREGCQVDPILEILEVLAVIECDNLTTLVPSSATFSHLTYLRIEKCNGLISLICSSTGTSMVNLQGITLKACNSLEEIMTQGVNKTGDEIVFKSLTTLELESLPRLNYFSSSQGFFRFPLLKRVVVRQCARMKTFCESEISTPMLRKVTIKEGKDDEWCWQHDLNRTIKKMYADKIGFRDMDQLDLSLYPELRDSWNSPVENKIFSNLKCLVVQHCDFLSDVLIPSNLLQSLVNLEEIQVRDCDSLQVVLEFDTANEEAISEKEASHLQKIYLSNLPKLQYIWKSSLGGEWEEDEAQIQRQQPLSFIAKVIFPHLKEMKIKDMPELKTLWHPLFTSNCFSSLKSMVVSRCEKLEKIFPTYMQRVVASVEKLKVSDCESMQFIFEVGSTEDTTTVRELIELTLLRLSMLEQIWSSDPHLRFHKLQLVRVEACKNLEYLLPFSIAMHAIRLEVITIKNAWRLKQIVSHKEGPPDDPIKFEFSHMTSLVFWNLYELEGFFAGNHSLLCPLLRVLDSRRCVKLKLFKTQGTSGQVSVQQPLFTLEEVICNLKVLALNSEDASMILQGQFLGKHFRELKSLNLVDFKDDHATFPYWFLQNITTLNQLLVEDSSFKEIFRQEVPIGEKGKFKIKTRIEKLILNALHDLQHICKEGFQIDPVIEALEYLKVNRCSNLERLVPSSVTFSHLTYLEVRNCNGLIYLITSSTARSLAKLTTMKIMKCNSLEQAVAEDMEESKDVITFNSLEVLELECLPTLKMFCSSSYCLLELPWLEKVVISNCPGMEIFSLGKTETSILQTVLTQKEDGKEHWQGDLNTTVNKIFQDMANQVVVTTKQETLQLPSSSDDGDQKKNDSSRDPQDAEMNGDIEKPLIQTTQEAHIPATIQDIATGTQEIHDPIQIASARNAEESHDSSIGAQDMCDTVKKPSISNAQNVPSSTMIPNAECPSPSQAPGLATAPDTGVNKNLLKESYNSYIDNQEMYDTIKKPSSPTDQNVPNSAMIPDDAATIDPSPSKAPEHMTSSILEPNAYSNYSWLNDISPQNLPYWEVGVKRHPQVLDWFNTKQRGVFAALFTEIIRILRTTRRRDLTEDDRNHIRECCAALEVIGFDASWLSYVRGCIETCVDGDELKIKLEETEAKASTLRNELASVEASLVSLRDEVSRLDNFIES